MLAMFTVAVLAVLAAGALLVTSNNYKLAHQTASWQNALLASESGVEVAVTEARRSVFAPGTEFSAANGWQKGEPFVDVNGNGVWDTGEAFTDLTGSGTYNPNVWVYYGNLSGMSSEGAKNSSYISVVDIPAYTVGNEPYYRVRSIGMTELTGSASVAGLSQDNDLRKLSIRTDRITKTALKAGSSTVGGGPHATRVVEVILKPFSSFRTALFSTQTIDMTDQNIVVDSYDSRDPSKSTNGQYDPAKRQSNGNIATDGNLIDAGNAHIYGDAATHDGTVLNSNNVTGNISSNFWEDVFAVKNPDVTFLTTPTTVSNTSTLTATAGTPSQYKLSTINLSGTNMLRLQGAADGSATYIQIVVTGDISLTGQAQITMDPGVYVRIFVDGNADIEGNGFSNPGSALNLQLYGVDKTNPDGTPATNTYGSIKIAGNGGFKGAVYAPDYDIYMKGGGNTDSIYGSFSGHTITMTGIQSVHYDEAMAEGGLISDYKIASWFEDVR